MARRARNITDADRAKGAEWRRNNPEKRRAAQARYRAKNVVKVREMKAAWYAANRELLLARATAWQAANPGSRRATSLRRRAAGHVTVEQIAALLARPCAYCGRPSEHVDHIVPICRGGTSDMSNLAAACARCNMRKGRQTAAEFTARG